ncbi:uncharacterized protein BDV17DRAFT_50734 [Aspergillus undulatus]|uniref:uncharacterized protein n=1 Tax=Aspergillus undulatus TaxID=1810928 RepID=UPI003CCD513C
MHVESGGHPHRGVVTIILLGGSSACTMDWIRQQPVSNETMDEEVSRGKYMLQMERLLTIPMPMPASDTNLAQIQHAGSGFDVQDASETRVTIGSFLSL